MIILLLNQNFGISELKSWKSCQNTEWSCWKTFCMSHMCTCNLQSVFQHEHFFLLILKNIVKSESGHAEKPFAVLGSHLRLCMKKRNCFPVQFAKKAFHEKTAWNHIWHCFINYLQWCALHVIHVTYKNNPSGIISIEGERSQISFRCT